jgi:orotate phosphoribosyltransferase
MSDVRGRLLNLLKERSLRLGTFTLASGKTSSYYIDGRMTAVFSQGAYLIGEAIYERTADLNLDALGGLETGAIPLTTAAVISYHLHDHALEGFWVRDQVKDHGTKRLIEGNLKPGMRVAVVDDVITTGTSVIKAVEAVRQLGCTVETVVTLVDRLQGAADLFHRSGIRDYRPLFTIAELGVDVEVPASS